jgi:hypothetical protein
MAEEPPEARTSGGKAGVFCQRVEESPRRPFHLVVLAVAAGVSPAQSFARAAGTAATTAPTRRGQRVPRVA